jgi:hypothetical protein
VLAVRRIGQRGNGVELSKAIVAQSARGEFSAAGGLPPRECKIATARLMAELMDAPPIERASQTTGPDGMSKSFKFP